MADLICKFCKKPINIGKVKRQRALDGKHPAHYFPMPSEDFPFHQAQCFAMWMYCNVDVFQSKGVNERMSSDAEISPIYQKYQGVMK